MKNKELLNICYKFFNRFIIADELIEQLANIDMNGKSAEERKKIKELIDEIKDILIDIPNEVDDFAVQKKKNIKSWINKLEKIPQNDDDIQFLTSHLENLKNDYNKEIDSYERWFKITDCINQNAFFNECFDNLSDYELLEFIAQYIKASFPPQLTQEEFENLVKVGIENDEREWLWRLAFNYENSGINFDSIVDYFIKVADGYYLSELICAVSGCLNIDEIIDKIKDKKLIEDLKKRKNVLTSYVSDEQFNNLFGKLE